MDVTMTERRRFFRGGRIERLSVRVDGDGTIRVWDSVARHYTTCHSLGATASRAIRRRADAVRSAASPVALSEAAYTGALNALTVEGC